MASRMRLERASRGWYFCHPRGKLATIVVVEIESSRGFNRDLYRGAFSSRAEANNNEEKQQVGDGAEVIGQGYILSRDIYARAGRQCLRAFVSLGVSIEKEGLQGSAIHIGSQPETDKRERQERRLYTQ